MTKLAEDETEKTEKLKEIAVDKYKLDLTKLDDYLPKGREWYSQLAKAEKTMVESAKKQRSELRTLLRSKSMAIDDNRKTLQSKQEKIDALKQKLKKRTTEAKDIIERALAIGQVSKVKQLQDLNINVVALLEAKEIQVK